jgi:bifunctional DNA-binding transcriptional regulator/antitoxin component of YhaV-PrlF toxin-antitoxin module
MSEFMLRVAAKRQVTLPEELFNALQLKQGDELGVEVRSPFDIRLVPYARVQRAVLTPELQALLEKRAKSLDAGGPVISLEDLEKRSATKMNKTKKKKQVPVAA